MKVMAVVGGVDRTGGGVAASIIEISKIMNKKNFDYIVFTTNAGYYKKLNVELNKITIYEGGKFFFTDYPDNRIYRIVPTLYYSGIFGWNLFKSIYRHIKSYDIIHIYSFFSFIEIFVYFISRLFKKPYIIKLSGSLMREAYSLRKLSKIKKDIYLKIIGKIILKNAKYIQLLTDEEKSNFIEFFPEFEHKIKIIPNGLDLSQFEVDLSKSDLIEKYPQLKDKKIVLFLSRINRKKGLDILIPSFAKLYKEDKNCHLLIAGKDDGDGYEKKVRQWVSEYGLSDAVTFAGLLTGRDKLMAFYGSDLFVLPSYSENFGVAVVEAMACGIPIVVSDKVGISREIMQYNAGTIVKTNVDDVYNGIKNAFSNLDKAKDMALNGRIMVYDLYDINNVVDKMIKMYEEAINSR